MADDPVKPLPTPFVTPEMVEQISELSAENKKSGAEPSSPEKAPPVSEPAPAKKAHSFALFRPDPGETRSHLRTPNLLDISNGTPQDATLGVAYTLAHSHPPKESAEEALNSGWHNPSLSLDLFNGVGYGFGKNSFYKGLSQTAGIETTATHTLHWNKAQPEAKDETQETDEKWWKKGIATIFGVKAQASALRFKEDDSSVVHPNISGEIGSSTTLPTPSYDIGHYGKGGALALGGETEINTGIAKSTLGKGKYFHIATPIISFLDDTFTILARYNSHHDEKMPLELHHFKHGISIGWDCEVKKAGALIVDEISSAGSAIANHFKKDGPAR